MDKKIKRTPIVLNPHTIALISIFIKHEHLEDIWYSGSDIEKFVKEQIHSSSRAAKQFIAQLEGHWTPRFLKALRTEIDSVLKSGYKK